MVGIDNSQACIANLVKFVQDGGELVQDLKGVFASGGSKWEIFKAIPGILADAPALVADAVAFAAAAKDVLPEWQDLDADEVGILSKDAYNGVKAIIAVFAAQA